jgi:hypothetical protein
MSGTGPEFFQTPMGRRFYERDVPRAVDALSEIAKILATQTEAGTLNRTALMAVLEGIELVRELERTWEGGELDAAVRALVEWAERASRTLLRGGGA